MVAAIGMIVPDLFGRFGGYLSPSMDLYHGLKGGIVLFFFHTDGLFGGFKRMVSEMVCCVFWESKVGFLSISHMFCVCVFLWVCGTYILL